MTNHLVVGINGTIGSALFQKLNQNGEPVWGTTKRLEDVKPKQVFYLNLYDDLTTWQLPDISFDVAYLCAGICKMPLCEADPSGTSKVNIDGMSEFAQLLSKQGAFIVYLSTNQVFAGQVPNIPEDAPYQPLNEYGRQKAIVETIIKEKCEPKAIVRLTKVIEPNMPLIQHWIDQLRNNAPIEVFHNMMLAPVSLRQVIDFLILLGEKKKPGCYALSGDQDVSYLDMANYLANMLNASQDLIKPKDAKDHGIKKNFLPRFTTMRSSSTIALGGQKPPNIVDVLQECFNLK